jgi:hypothetical protein
MPPYRFGCTGCSRSSNWPPLISHPSSSNDVELLALRHEVTGAPTRQSAATLRLGGPGRVRRPHPVRARGLRNHLLVTPGTILRWHRQLVRKRWIYLNRPGRAPIIDIIAALVVRMGDRTNSRWKHPPFPT